MRACRVYWGSHGCRLERGHPGTHECECCDCGPVCRPECVAKWPHYGAETMFYGEDAVPDVARRMDGPADRNKETRGGGKQVRSC